MIRLKRNIFALLLSSANEYLYCVVSSSIYILIFFLEDQSYLLYFHQKAIKQSGIDTHQDRDNQVNLWQNYGFIIHNILLYYIIYLSRLSYSNCQSIERYLLLFIGLRRTCMIYPCPISISSYEKLMTFHYFFIGGNI